MGAKDKAASVRHTFKRSLGASDDPRASRQPAPRANAEQMGQRRLGIYFPPLHHSALSLFSSLCLPESLRHAGALLKGSGALAASRSVTSAPRNPAA